MQINYLPIIDGLFILLIFYKVFKSIKGTRGLSILLGLIVTSAMYGASLHFNLEKTKFILDPIFKNLFIVVIFLFQEEFKKTFAEAGLRTFNLTKIKKLKRPEEIASIITDVAFDFSRKKIGALIIIENDMKLNNIKETGSLLNCEINQQLLYSIFTTGSTLHDGAVVIANNKIESAGCYLPLSKTVIDKKLGTRHRAALGLSEVTDATIVVVSEETSEVKVVFKGTFTTIKSKEELIQMIIKKDESFSFKKFFN